ncbi:MAG TPA: hypothetical protein VGM33_06005 [Baekduia sp.]|jgi:hypothetical protein
MEWVALMVWVLVVSLALPVALGALSGALGLGLQGAAAIGGLALTILFIIFDGPLWMGWAAFAMAVLGILGGLAGADTLTSDERAVSPDLQAAEETEALLLGVQLPLYGVALFCSVCLAVNLATVA